MVNGSKENEGSRRYVSHFIKMFLDLLFLGCVEWTRRIPWWRHEMEKFSALLVLCAGNSPVTGEFPTQRPVTRSFDVFFDLRLNERLSKQSWGWWFESHRVHYDVIVMNLYGRIVVINTKNTCSVSVFPYANVCLVLFYLPYQKLTSSVGSINLIFIHKYRTNTGKILLESN